MNFNERTTALLHAPLSPLTWDSMWRECQAIEDDNPYIPSGYLWVLEYKRYKIEMARGNSWQATRHLRNAIALTPYADELVQEYVRLCRKDSEIAYLALIVTCKKNEAKRLSWRAILMPARSSTPSSPARIPTPSVIRARCRSIRRITTKVWAAR